jgi:hypothetical protein
MTDEVSGEARNLGMRKLWRRALHKSRGNSYGKPRLLRSCSTDDDDDDDDDDLGYDIFIP